MAGSDKEFTQEDVNRAVSEVMGDRKVVYNPSLLSAFVPKNSDEKQISDGFFALRFRYFDSSRGSDRILPSDADDRGSFWILQKVPGLNAPVLKEMKYDSDAEWATRWASGSRSCW
jgi:hypothetical protein